MRVKIPAEAAGQRLDRVLASLPEVDSRQEAQRLLAAGGVTVDGTARAQSYRVAGGEELEFDPPEHAETELQAEDVDLRIAWEDEHLLVVDKPAGVVVHPAPGHAGGTLVHSLLAHGAAGGEAERPGIVHRLDRDTSGVILVAKNDAAHNALAKQLKERTVEKTYLALVEGTPKPMQGVIDAPIARDSRNRQRMAVVEGGRESVTSYSVVERFSGYSLVEARPKTGRTHQIRVHLAAIGHPMLGDRVYGKPSNLVGRQFLHAARIAFLHPRSGRRMELEAKLAEDLEAALVHLRASS